VEFLERLPQIAEDERWLVRDGDAERIAIIVTDFDDAWLGRVLRAAGEWTRFEHVRVTRVRSASRVDDSKVLCVVDDERGPTYADAAATLADAPADRERWAVAQMIAIADAIAAMAAHERGFIHRQLEPELIWVDQTGRARLRAPVGLNAIGPAQRTYVGAGRVIGTPMYMSPEQASGLPLTPASDVFALAGNLVTALAGEPPFPADDSPMQVLVSVLQAPARIPACTTPGLALVLERAFAKKPEQRYPDPAAFAHELYEVVPDAGDYDAVISDRLAAWWPTAPRDRPSPPVGARCRMSWEAMTPTMHADVRRCGNCREEVVRVRSVGAALQLFGRRCVSFEPQ
jgi:serine/threonine protein kinase